MACRCADVGLAEIFNERFARRDAARYRKRGLPARARLLLELVESSIDLRGRRSLEGGAGAGALTVELARRGVTAAQGIDAMPVAVEYATQLAAQFGVAEHAHFRAGDFADPDLAAEPADLVILDRVVCCYPDWRGLLANATQRAEHVIALSYPPANALTRFEIAALNGVQALLRRRFRIHLHPPAAMLALLREHGFTNVQRRRYWFWEIAVAHR